MKFNHRSNLKELLDQEDIPREDLYLNLKELHIINKRLGGYNASRKGLSLIARSNPQVKNMLDIGFGGGDSIKQISEFSKLDLRTNLFFYGVDLKKDCLTYAENNLASVTNKELMCENYKNISPELLKEIDIIHCSLFLHHLNDTEIIDLFKFAKAQGCIVLANDLHRNWLAYYSIKLLTGLFSRSYLVKNDAPVSVLRGFKKVELIDLLKQAGFTDFSVSWSWAFRYIIIARK